MSSPHTDSNGLKSVCIEAGHWRVAGYDVLHQPQAQLLSSAWVIWCGLHPVAVTETLPQARDWIAARPGAGAQ